MAASHLDVIFCILDALDQCEAESISELSLIITKMTEASKESEEDSPKLKFYLTSQPFQSLKEDLATARVIYLTPEIVKPDIEKVVDHGMERLQRRLCLEKDVKDRLWNMLVERSEGIFRWVLLALLQLDRERGLTAQKLEALVQGLPKGVDGIYNRMLEALENDPTTLYTAAYKGTVQVLRLFLDRGADIESRNQHGLTLLYIAAQQGHTQVVSLLLDRGADIESRDEHDRTALYIAAYKGHTQAVSLLLDRVVDIKSNPQSLSKVLNLAVLYDRCDIVSYIIDNLARLIKATVQSAFSVSAGILQLAILRANRKIFRLLLDHEIDVSIATLRGCTALHVAASCGHSDIVESLLGHGADPHMRDIQGWSPIDCARKSQKSRVIDRLSQLQTSSPDDHQIVTQSPTHWSPEDKSIHLELSDGHLHVRASGKNYHWSRNDVTSLMFQEGIAKLKVISAVRSNFCMPTEKDNCYYEVKIIGEATARYIY